MLSHTGALKLQKALTLERLSRDLHFKWVLGHAALYQTFGNAGISVGHIALARRDGCAAIASEAGFQINGERTKQRYVQTLRLCRNAALPEDRVF